FSNDDDYRQVACCTHVLYSECIMIQKGVVDMANSSAKKIREKRMREGKRNLTNDRGTYAIADLESRTSKRKHEMMDQYNDGELPKVNRNKTDGSSFVYNPMFQKLRNQVDVFLRAFGSRKPRKMTNPVNTSEIIATKCKWARSRF